MPAGVFVAILAAALLHASWNALAKSGEGDALTRAALIAMGGGLSALPALLLTGLPGLASWPYLVASAIIHVGYFTLVGLAYRHADFSAIYPLVRGMAPVFTALIAAGLLGELLTPLAWAGVALLCGGILALGTDGLRRGGLDKASLAVAGLTAAIVVAYTLVDGIGARLSGNPQGYVAGLMALTGFLVLPVAAGFRSAALRTALPPFWPKALIGGAMVNLSYGIALWAMTKAPIGLVGALRETSVLFATLIASLVLSERFGGLRWIAAIVIVAGLALVQAA